MPSQFGGVEIEEEPIQSQFGGVSIVEPQPVQVTGPEAFTAGAKREAGSMISGAEQIALPIGQGQLQAQASKAQASAGLLRLLGFGDIAEQLEGVAPIAEQIGETLPQSQQEIIERERQAEAEFAPIEEQQPFAAGAGRVVAAAIPFAAAAPTTLTGAAVVGGVEGAIQFAETDSDRVINTLLGTALGTAGQKAFDVISQFGGKVVDSVRGIFSDPSGELIDQVTGDLTAKGNKAIIEATGADTLAEAKKIVSDDVVKAVDKSLADKIPEVELRRKVLQEQFGIEEPRKSLLTGSSADQALEQELLKAQDPQFLALRNQEEIAFKNAARQNIEEVSGIKLPENFDKGDINALKEGLSLDTDEFFTNLKKADLAEIDNLYGFARGQAGNVLPVEQAGILTNFKKEFVELSPQLSESELTSVFGGIRGALQDLGVIPKTKESIKNRAKQLVTKGGHTPDEALVIASQIEPLTLGKAQDLIKRLNSISRNSTVPVTRKVVGSVKASIYDAVDEIATTNNLGSEAATAFTNARAARRAHAENFEPQIMERLTGFRPDDVTPKVPAEKMFNEISKAPLESLSAVKSNLLRAGAPGRQLWNRIQSQNALELLGKSFTGKTEDGTLMISGAKLKSAMSAIGPRRLKEMFNKTTLDKFKLIASAKEPAVLNEGVYTPSGVQAERGARQVVEAVNDLARTAAIFNFNPVVGAVRTITTAKPKAKAKVVRQIKKAVINPDITTAADMGSLSPNGLIASRLIGGLRAGGIATPIVIGQNFKDALQEEN